MRAAKVNAQTVAKERVQSFGQVKINREINVYV